MRESCEVISIFSAEHRTANTSAGLSSHSCLAPFDVSVLVRNLTAINRRLEILRHINRSVNDNKALDEFIYSKSITTQH